MLKFIAVGNRLMTDDGVAIAVAENLKIKLEALGFEVIIVETDFQFCFHVLNADDFVIILDAVYFNGNPGNVDVLDLQEASFWHEKLSFQHEISIFDLMKIYSKPLKGYLIGIETAKIDFGIELSDVLMHKFDNICLEVERIIYNFIKHNNCSSGIQ